MDLWKMVKYTALAFVVLSLTSIVVSVIATLVGLVWVMALTVTTLLLVLGSCYAVVKGALWLLRDDPRATEPAQADRRSADPLERLRERYVRGELTELELERRLERELSRGHDDIDRKAERPHAR